MLWIDEKTNNRRRMGMGMVVSDRCSASFARSHDFESNVRRCRNSTRCSTHCDRRRSVQNHEGINIPDVTFYQHGVDSFCFFFTIESETKCATINTMAFVWWKGMKTLFSTCDTCDVSLSLIIFSVMTFFVVHNLLCVMDFFYSENHSLDTMDGHQQCCKTFPHMINTIPSYESIVWLSQFGAMHLDQFRMQIDLFFTKNYPIINAFFFFFF